MTLATLAAKHPGWQLLLHVANATAATAATSAAAARAATATADAVSIRKNRSQCGAHTQIHCGTHTYTHTETTRNALKWLRH